MSVQEFTFDDIRNILVNRIGLSEDDGNKSRKRTYS